MNRPDIVPAERWLKAHIAVSAPNSVARSFTDEQLKIVASYATIYHEQTADPDQMLAIVEGYESKRRLHERDSNG